MNVQNRPSPPVSPPRPSTAFACLAAFFVGFLVFFMLRGFRVPGGDSVIILSNDWYCLLWSNPIVYYAREPFSHGLAHLIYGRIGNLPLAFAVYSALGGGLFLAVLAAWCRRPLAWLVVLASAATWNFAGHIEYYAPVMVTLLIFLLTLARALEPEPRARPVHVAAAFAVSFLFHKLTLFFLPATLWLFFARRQGRWIKRPQLPRQAEWCLAALVAMALADVIPSLVIERWGAWVNAVYVPVNEGLMDLLTPLTPGIARHFEAKSITGMFYVYTFGQPKHFAYFFGFLLAGAPLGLALTLWHWRKIFQSDAAKALATAAACGLIWTFMWQPRGFWKDWDLFCLAGLPINVLGAGLALGLWRGGPPPGPASRREWLIAAGGLAVFVAVMCAATVRIQAQRLRPGYPVMQLGDTPVLERSYEVPPPFALFERDYGVTLDRARTASVFVFPYQGLSSLWDPEGKAVLAASDEKGKIVSTAVVRW